MIEITFGMALDGARWSEGPASIGKMTCGPLGMLKFLETRLGLGGLEVPQAERIGAFLEKMRAVYKAEPKSWGAESFAKDYWSTAKTLLAWRDELIDAGWDGRQGGSDRLDLLAKIESSGIPTPDGLPDRVRRAVEKCSKELMSDVNIVLVDDLDKYPHHWKALFRKLGVKSQWEKPVFPESAPKNKVEVVASANEFQSAGLLLRDLRKELDADRKVAVIAEGDTQILDGFLHREGLPAIGQGQSSAERAAIQILPLWIEYMWEPFMPMTLLAILKSEVSPFIPGRKEGDKFKKVGLQIVDALREAPGIGGKAWNDAWKKIGPDFADYREVLEAPRYDPEGDGVPYGEFAKRIDWLVARLRPKVAVESEYLDDKAKGLLKGTIQNATRLKNLAKSLEKINRVAVRRLLETIVATGTKMPGSRREVAPWRVYKHPGQITADADCILWWNFCDSGHGSGTYWTDEERSVLGDGVQFDTENAIVRESDGWCNALKRARKSLKLYYPMTASGKECSPHPFLADLIQLHYVEDKELIVQEDDSVRAIEMPANEGEAEEPLAVSVAPNAELKPRSLSATQLETLLTCPFKWYLEKHLNLREQDALALPTGAPMIGTLAHKVVETIIKVDKESEADKAAELAGKHFDELVPQMAAELGVPDRKVERDDYRRTLMESVKDLWGAVKRRGLRFVEAEKVLDRKGAFRGIDFTGRADIVLEDANGKPYVVDLKWSSGTHYIEAADNGRSIQLATYAWAIDPIDMAVASAYYMFPKKIFYDNPQDDKDVWRKIERDYGRTMDEMKRGELHRGYAEGETELGLEPRCGFCSFKSLCGKERK